MELWIMRSASPRGAIRFATTAEKSGWSGVAFVDSQNLAGDCYVALALAATATTELGLATGVTNPVTRHPAVTAAAIAAVQVASGGRAVLGIGRGDSALAHLGRAPASVAALERYVVALQQYLSGEDVAFADLDFHERLAPPVESLGLADTPATSRLGWLGGDLAKVPVEVAASGPKVIGIAARYADRVLLAVGADPERVAWGVEQARAARRQAGLDPEGVSIGAVVNMACHTDPDTARTLVSGGVASVARFSVMHGTPTGPASEEQRKVLAEVHSRYDMRHHTEVGSDQTAALSPSFVDRYAIAGAPAACIDRINELSRLGVDKLVVIGPTWGSDPEAAATSDTLLAREVLPVVCS